MTHQELQRMNDVISENRSLKQANEELRQTLNALQREHTPADCPFDCGCKRVMPLHQEDYEDYGWDYTGVAFRSTVL